MTWHTPHFLFILSSFSNCSYSLNSAWIPLKFKMWLSKHSTLSIFTCNDRAKVMHHLTWFFLCQKVEIYLATHDFLQQISMCTGFQAFT